MDSLEVTPFRTATNTAGKPIPIKSSGAYEVTITPNGKTAYVTSGAGVIPIRTANNTEGATILDSGVGLVPVAITPNGKAAYAVNSFANTVIPINTRTNEAGKAIPVGEDPAAIAIMP